MLFLFPAGLFADEDKNMTMELKIDIPDESPRLRPTETFTLTWAIGPRSDKALASSKKPLKIKFTEGRYIHNLVPISEIRKSHCDEFYIDIQTSYTPI